MNLGVTAVMPIKSWDRAKSRLHRDYEIRRVLAKAISQDTLASVMPCSRISQIIVVTDDDSVRAYASALGLDVIEEPAPQSTDNLAAAIQTGIDWCLQYRPGHPVVVVPSDLPALKARDLTEVLELADGHRNSFVPDTSGLGTTLCMAAVPVHLRHRYGPDSARLHRESGVFELSGINARVRRDVDTMSDLLQARQLGLGPNTRIALDSLSRSEIDPLPTRSRAAVS